jgi:Right handed beta helix region
VTRLFAACALQCVTMSVLCDAHSVSLRPGDDIQAAIEANPGRTVFVMAPGTYRGASFIPKQGDRFTGTPATEFNGSLLLTGRWTRSDRGDFRLDQMPLALPASGKASSGHRMASHPQDLFVDGMLYHRVASRLAIGPGKWFFEELERRAYTSDDLNGHIVEITETQQAIGGNAADVVLENLTVERYATPAQLGAIVVRGDRWILTNLTVRQNHAGGASVFGNAARIEGGHYSDNGQEGISGYRCDGLVVENAEVARNNYAGFDMNWEAGGIKVSTASGITFAGNVVHDNHGMGIWDDGGVSHATIRGNQVIGNEYNGIMHEISYDAVIIANRVVRNGSFQGNPVVPAGILLQNSSNVTVRDNYVETGPDTGNGIALTYEPRGSGAQGPYRTDHNDIHDNVVVFPGPGGMNGILAYSDRSTALAFHNIWASDRYVLSDRTRPVFDMLGDLLTLQEAQGRKLENGSSIVNPGSPVVP